MDVSKFLNVVPNFLKFYFGVGKISYNFPLSVENFFFLQIILNKFFHYDYFKIIYIYLSLVFLLLFIQSQHMSIVEMRYLSF